MENSEAPHSSGASSLSSSKSSSSDEMEGVEEQRRGRKRELERWEARWETDEQRNVGKNQPLEVGGQEDGRGEAQEELEGQARRALRDLRRSEDIMEYAVEANRQMEEQERMQRQQEIEMAVQQAAIEVERGLQGSVAHGRTEGLPPAPPSNPRLELKDIRNRPRTPSARAASGSSISDSGIQEKKVQSKSRRRKERSHSRTPRSRALDRVD